MTAAANTETLGFQTEAKQLLHLMIHSLYSNKEIFLRELVSNASDACDKLRFEALNTPKLFEDAPDLQIRISIDEEQGTITIADNGIGMSRDEAIANLGTIARSGTASFMESLSGDEKKDSQLIGQFGVGFYSSFIVADKVVVQTRRAGQSADDGVQWSCSGEADYTVETINKPDRGTSITLHLKDDCKEFANNWQLRSIVKKYSDHIAIQIAIPKPPVDTGDDADTVTDTTTDSQSETEWEVINDTSALWMRPRNEISDDDYKHFYQHISHDFRDPLSWSHNRVEGKYDYTSLLYLPSEPPFDLYQRDTPHGINLYVQRTFIMDDAEQFLPLYLRFVKGVIDSNDLPLNISREILQSSPAVSSIRNALTKRSLDMLAKMAKDKTGDYAAFWAHFGSVLKEGVSEDIGNRDKIAKLLRFGSTASEKVEDLVSLTNYFDRMKENQSKIYYLIADSDVAARHSPYLEIFKKHNLEVLLLTDRIDEWLMSHLSEFEGKSLQNIAKGELNLDELSTDKNDESTETKHSAAENNVLTEKIKALLADVVADVRISQRLTDSPACLVVGEQDMGVQMRRILEAAGQQAPETKPTLEINPNHPLMAVLATDDDSKNEDFAWVLYGQAMLSSGDQLENSADFVQRLNRLLLAVIN